MKKYLLFCLCVCLSVSARAEYLDDKIATLTQQKLDLIAELEKCQKASGNLKIAGITTLGVSAIGIGANIAEAVALNKTQGKIDNAKENLDDLNKEIENNTCGSQQCDEGTKNSKKSELHATDVVCVNGAWVAKTCEDNYDGTAKTCTLNGSTVTYHENCNPVVPGTVEKSCNEITQEWLDANNAKAGACDKTTGKNYITQCADKFNAVPRTTGNKQGYEKCEKQENAQPTIPEKKYHDLCTDDETAKIPNAQESWWYIDKCVAKSCKPGTYLHVNNGVSQGQCKTDCPAWQIMERWPNGGKACDVAKQKQNCNRKVYGKNEYTSGQCQAKCEEYANESACNLTGDAVEITSANQCVCNPVQSDVTKSKQVTQENKPDCAEKKILRANARDCDALCKQYAAENDCSISKSGSVTTTNMVACYCNPSDTVTLDGPNKRSGGWGSASGVIGGF